MTDVRTTPTAERTRAYRDGVLLEVGFPVEQVSDHLEDPSTVVWVDLCAPSADEVVALAAELDLHELAVEDAVGPHQRPKLDHYARHRFLVCHAARVDPATGALETTEVDAFIGRRWLVTVRKSDGFDLGPVLRRWDRSPDLAPGGVGFLLYGLLDVVVDGWFQAVEAFDAFYEDVSDALFSEAPMSPTDQRQWFEMRRSLVRFHRLVGPLREVVSGLSRQDHGIVDERLAPYYRDVHDHVLRVGEATDSLRELVATLVETNLSLRDYRQNQIVKQVTSWAAIIAVPTLITGFFGMNVPFPGEGDPWGVVLAVVLVVAASLALFATFRHRGWL